MAKHAIKHAIAQTHFDTYAAAIKAGKTPAQAMQLADTAANAKRHALLETHP